MPNCKIWCKYESKYKFGTKSALFGYFWAEILKNYSSNIGNQTCQICLIAKFNANKNSLNSGPKMPYLGFLGLKFEQTIVIIEMSALEFV